MRAKAGSGKLHDGIVSMEKMEGSNCNLGWAGSSSINQNV